MHPPADQPPLAAPPELPAPLAPPELPAIGPNSSRAFERARAVFPDGTARVTIERAPTPRYMARGDGAYLVDLDGRRFLDLNGNFTTLIHGHNFAPVVEAVTRQLRSGSCFANPTEIEIALAELLCERIPGVARARFVNTGTEAVMFAVKAARAFTGRQRIAKIEGAYHGAYDWVEVSQAATPDNWGDGARPASSANYAGMPPSVLDEVVVLRFNDAEGARRILATEGAGLAALVLDPMPSRGGLIAPRPDFIAAIQAAAQAHGFLVIADEVLNLRQGYHGASARYGLTPDLLTLGKIIGGGLPIGAIGGRQAVMAMFDAGAGRPPVPQGGTFSANPLSMTAGLAAMQALDRPAFDRLERLGSRLRDGLQRVIDRTGAPFSVTGAASLFRLHPMRRPPGDYRDSVLSPAQTAVMQALTGFYAAHGVILPLGAAACLSTPMGDAEIETVIGIFDDFLATRAGLLDGLKD